MYARGGRKGVEIRSRRMEAAGWRFDGDSLRRTSTEPRALWENNLELGKASAQPDAAADEIRIDTVKPDRVKMAEGQQ